MLTSGRCLGRILARRHSAKQKQKKKKKTGRVREETKEIPLGFFFFFARPKFDNCLTPTKAK